MAQGDPVATECLRAVVWAGWYEVSTESTGGLTNPSIPLSFPKLKMAGGLAISPGEVE